MDDEEWRADNGAKWMKDMLTEWKETGGQTKKKEWSLERRGQGQDKGGGLRARNGMQGHHIENELGCKQSEPVRARVMSSAILNVWRSWCRAPSSGTQKHHRLGTASVVLNFFVQYFFKFYF